MRRLLAAPDKFRGTATAAEVAAAAARGAAAAGWQAEVVPLADGGEGTIDVLGGANRRSPVTGPLGDRVEAAWRLSGRTAFIEMARASGLELAGGPDRNRPLDATTAGTGELILAALAAGARRIVVCLGGSATTDGGIGALEAIGSPARLEGVDLVVACDVDTPFRRAAEVFGPQKGASAAQVAMLTRRLDRLAQMYSQRYGVDVDSLDGAGAAGGLAGGLAALGGTLVPGFEVVADALELDEKVVAADLVMTGEGFVDEASFHGKVVGGVLEMCSEYGRPALVVAGELLVEPGVPAVSLVDRFGRDRSLADAAACVEQAVREELGSRLRGAGRASRPPAADTGG